MTQHAVPIAVARKPLMDDVFGALWPEAAPAGRPRLVAASCAVGLLASVVVPFRDLGLGTFLVLAVLGGVVAVADTRLRSPYHLVSLGLCVALMSTLFLRDAEWIVVLCLLAAFAVGAAALADGRSVIGLLGSAMAVPLAGVRGLPWLGRSCTPARAPMRWWPVLRTIVVSGLLVVVFVALFASADALFASWVEVFVPDLTLDTLALRAFIVLAVGGLTLAGVYVGVNPPSVERLALPRATAVSRAFEWLVPVGLVVVVYAGFVGAQLAAMFGGHDYVSRTTGLSYADYVHQGFAQLTVATALTLVVVAIASRKAARAESRDRLVLRLVLGSLCALTLVVVASALFRIHVYEEAYGFTRLRLLVSAFEGWLGLVVVLVLVAGITLRGWWVPRAALLAGACTLLALAALNPDAFIADRNVERYAETGKIDWYYLDSLSDDAAPALAPIADQAPVCLAGDAAQDDWLEWNLGRSRAKDVRAACP